MCKGCSHDFVEMTVLHKFHAAYRAGLYCDGLVSDDLFDRRAQEICLKLLTLDEFVPFAAARAADCADEFSAWESAANVFEQFFFFQTF